MEIDDINLQDELTSGFLEKYLTGEISFNEWLQLQSGDSANTEENVVDNVVVSNEFTDAADDDIIDIQDVGAPDDNGVSC